MEIGEGKGERDACEGVLGDVDPTVKKAVPKCQECQKTNCNPKSKKHFQIKKPPTQLTFRILQGQVCDFIYINR